MRILRLILAALAVAATQSAWAFQQSETLILLEDFRADSDIAVRNARQQLQNRLNGFKLDVARVLGRRAPFGNFEIRPTQNIERDAQRRWKRDTLVVVWGTIDVDRDFWPTGTLYIGPYRVRSEQGVHNRFDGVVGRIYRRSTSVHELDLYEIIIGYALLNRVWRDYPEAVPAVAQVLESRIVRASGRLNRSAATCLASLRVAVRDVVRREGRGERPSANSPRTPAPEPISC